MYFDTRLLKPPRGLGQLGLGGRSGITADHPLPAGGQSQRGGHPRPGQTDDQERPGGQRRTRLHQAITAAMVGAGLDGPAGALIAAERLVQVRHGR